MELVEFADKALFPMTVTLLYAIFYIYRFEFFSKIKKYLKNKAQIKALKLLAYNFKFKLGNWIFTILIPMISAIILDIIIMLIFRIPMRPYDEPFWFILIFRSLINPIAEEVVVRAFILGAFFLTTITLVEMLYRRKFNPIFKKFWMVCSLVLQVIIFATAHENPALFNWVIRISSGFLYGGFYLLSKRNLLPPIVAHITHNLVITLS